MDAALVLGILSGGAAAAALLLPAALARGSPATTRPQRVPFLGGLPPSTHAWSRHHLRAYPMTLLLVAFEMEMMFMYPWAAVFVREGGKAFAEMGMFLALLGVGVLYAAREGALGWQ